MLKKLSKSGEYTHLFIIAIVMVIYFFTDDIGFRVYEFPETAPIAKWLESKLIEHPGLNKLLNISLLVVISLFANRISVKSEITPRQSFITATLVSTLMLFSSPSFYFTVSLILMLLLLFALYNLLGMFGKQYPLLMVINASMAVSVASMILPFSLIFIIFIWFTFLTYSINSWREWIISILGIVIPYVYLFFAYFWNDNLSLVITMYSKFFTNLKFELIIPETPQLISLMITFVLFLISAFNFSNQASEKIISIRKKMWITFQFSLVSILMIVSGGKFYFLLLPVLYIPTAIMTAYTIHTSKKSTLFDILLVAIFISVLTNRISF